MQTANQPVQIVDQRALVLGPCGVERLLREDTRDALLVEGGLAQWRHGLRRHRIRHVASPLLLNQTGGRVLQSVSFLSFRPPAAATAARGIGRGSYTVNEGRTRGARRANMDGNDMAAKRRRAVDSVEWRRGRGSRASRSTAHCRQFSEVRVVQECLESHDLPSPISSCGLAALWWEVKLSRLATQIPPCSRSTFTGFNSAATQTQQWMLPLCDGVSGKAPSPAK
jgi:hypothetical protein